MSITSKLKEEYEARHKVLTQTPEESHLEVNFMRRMDYNLSDIYQHFPDNEARRQLLHHLNEARKFAHKCLEHKE